MERLQVWIDRRPTLKARVKALGRGGKQTRVVRALDDVNLEPTTALIIKNTIKVGRNLKSAITTAEIGNIIRGKAVLRISRGYVS